MCRHTSKMAKYSSCLYFYPLMIKQQNLRTKATICVTTGPSYGVTWTWWSALRTQGAFVFRGRRGKTSHKHSSFSQLLLLSRSICICLFYHLIRSLLKLQTILDGQKVLGPITSELISDFVVSKYNTFPFTRCERQKPGGGVKEEAGDAAGGASPPWGRG